MHTRRRQTERHPGAMSTSGTRLARGPIAAAPVTDQMGRLQRGAGNRAAGALVDTAMPAAEPGVRNSRAVTPHIQRAILAIDGARDDRTAKAATANCLTNLKSHKKIDSGSGKVPVEYPAGDARGQVFGPATRGTAVGSLKASASSINPLEAIYFLGHGSRSNVAGMTPAALAGDLVGAFAGYTQGTYAGALKIVACYSASTMEDGQSAPTAYADRVRQELIRLNDGTYRPPYVEGVKGIAWADEETGERVGYEVLGERLGQLSPLETVYTDSRVTQWFAALTEPDPVKRKADMDKIIADAHKTLGIGPEVARRILGKAARERYVTGSPAGDLTVATGQLDVAVKASPPNKKLAAKALKRMRLDWETMDPVDRPGRQNDVIKAYEAYLMTFQGRRPSWDAMKDAWPV